MNMSGQSLFVTELTAELPLHPPVWAAVYITSWNSPFPNSISYRGHTLTGKKLGLLASLLLGISIPTGLLSLLSNHQADTFLSGRSGPAIKIVL
jgi:hypothetical protein